MHSDPPHGNVLVLVVEPETGELLAREIAAAGERPFVLRADALFPRGATEISAVDLVVSDLGDDPPSRALRARLLTGEIFPSAPRIHLLHRALPDGEKLAETADGTTMPSPPDATEFRTRVRLAAEIGRLRREVARTATQDPLTGVSNRRFFLERLEDEFARARRYRSPLSLVLFDIDRLGRINDTFGDSTGDSVLKQLAEILTGQVRREDVTGRIAGATFAVLMPGNCARGAATFASKVRTEAEGVVLQHGGEIHQVHVSAGITTYPDSASAQTGERLVRAAEGALLMAKARGGNRVFIEEEALRHDRRVVLVADPDVELLDLAEDLLTLDDYQVVRADSPRIALETLRFRRPDLLIVDLQMAEHEGATPLIEQIHALFPEADFPVIGLAREGSLPGHLARVRVDRFITKPFSISLLRAAARELVEVRS